jgi:hypothetical protein
MVLRKRRIAWAGHAGEAAEVLIQPCLRTTNKAFTTPMAKGCSGIPDRQT